MEPGIRICLAVPLLWIHLINSVDQGRRSLIQCLFNILLIFRCMPYLLLNHCYVRFNLHKINRLPDWQIRAMGLSMYMYWVFLLVSFFNNCKKVFWVVFCESTLIFYYNYIKCSNFLLTIRYCNKPDILRHSTPFPEKFN